MASNDAPKIHIDSFMFTGARRIALRAEPIQSEHQTFLSQLFQLALGKLESLGKAIGLMGKRGDADIVMKFTSKKLTNILASKDAFDQEVEMAC